MVERGAAKRPHGHYLDFLLLRDNNYAGCQLGLLGRREDVLWARAGEEKPQL